MIALKTGQWIDKDLDDLLGGLLGHGFDVHAAGLTVHDDVLRRGAVGQDAEIKLLGDIEPLFHQDLAHPATFGAGLVRHQVHADDLTGKGFDFLGGLGQLDAAALAPAAGMDLGLDHHGVAPQPAGHFAGFSGRERHPALGDLDVELTEKFFGLVFVDLHDFSPGKSSYRQTADSTAKENGRRMNRNRQAAACRRLPSGC